MFPISTMEEEQPFSPYQQLTGRLRDCVERIRGDIQAFVKLPLRDRRQEEARHLAAARIAIAAEYKLALASTERASSPVRRICICQKPGSQYFRGHSWRRLPPNASHRMRKEGSEEERRARK